MSRSQSLSKKKHIVHPWASLTNRDMMVTVKENLAKEITTLPKKKKKHGNSKMGDLEYWFFPFNGWFSGNMLNFGGKKRFPAKLLQYQKVCTVG